MVFAPSVTRAWAGYRVGFRDSIILSAKRVASRSLEAEMYDRPRWSMFARKSTPRELNLPLLAIAWNVLGMPVSLDSGEKGGDGYYEHWGPLTALTRVSSLVDKYFSTRSALRSRTPIRPSKQWDADRFPGTIADNIKVCIRDSVPSHARPDIAHRL